MIEDEKRLDMMRMDGNELQYIAITCNNFQWMTLKLIKAA